MESVIVGSFKSRMYADNPQYINHNSSTEHTVCVYHAKGFSYAQYTRYYYLVPTWPAMGAVGESMVAVAIGQDTEFRPVVGFGDKDSDTQLYLGNSEAFLQHGSSDSGFRFYNDVVGHISQDADGSLMLEDDPDYRYTDAHGNQVAVDGVGLSINAEKISFGVKNFGIIMFDIITREATRVSDRYDVQSWTWPTPQLTTSVSNDGKYLVVGGMGYQTEVIVTTDCGSRALADGFAYRSQLLGEKACPHVDFTSLTSAHSQPTGGAGLRALSKLQMSGSGEAFTYWDNYKWGTIYAPNYLKPGQLYYLALGDSYASGEGDVTIDGTDHYLPGTNVYGNYLKGIPRETCRISTRSYPMRIASAMNLTRGSDMQSVACSGAVTTDILTTSAMVNGYTDTNYLGQSTQLISTSGPRLAGITNAAQLQANARVDYTPGRVQQIELVKKAQPQYVTIMAGGNDVDFGGVMTACAKNALPSADETCDYAHGDGLVGEVGKISNLYPTLIGFYKALKEVSPNTTIYVLGYPQFMDDSNESCVEMLNLYSKLERKAIHSFIAYANGVIRNAALDAGAKYIDVSDALTGSELCASGTSMTGITDALTTMIYTEYMKSLTMSDSELAKYLNLLPGTLHKAALQLYLVERSAELLGGFLYSPATAITHVLQALSHPNALGHEAVYGMIKQGLGDELLDSTLCNERVVCPSGTPLGRPDVGTYFPDLEEKEGIVYVSGNGKVTVGRIDGMGKITLGALTKSLTGQFIRISLSIIDGTIDPGQPVTVEIHSQPKMLGTMTRIGDGYELATAVPADVPVGQHVLHIKGSLLDGSAFDIDAPVFVEGPLGDIDDDGVADTVDMCAFSEASVVDANRNGIDDVCQIDDTNHSDIPIVPSVVVGSDDYAGSFGGNTAHPTLSGMREGGELRTHKPPATAERVMQAVMLAVIILSLLVLMAKRYMEYRQK